jgi:uncharacterized membrane protein YphA (DoxX/SURF4 family)
MKTNKITYWTATVIVSIMMLFSAYSYLANPAVAQGFHHLGFPDYFRVELAIAKLIGAVLLLAPFAIRIKEWAYAGFAITFISAFVAHTVSGDPVANRLGPIVFLILLVTSYITYHKLPGKSLKIITA